MARAVLMGILTGRGFGNAILRIVMPMMSGSMGAGVIPLSGIIAQFIPAFAIRNVLAIVCKVMGIVPEQYERAAVQWSQFVMKNLTNALLTGIGIALLDLKVLAASLTPLYLLTCAAIILPVALCAGLFGRLAGFYPVESSITAGLCTNSMGGTGNIAVLSAADRMGLIPFAQMATRLGGALILITAGFLVRLLA